MLDEGDEGDAGPLKRPAQNAGVGVEPTEQAKKRYRDAVARKYLLNKTSALETKQEVQKGTGRSGTGG